MVDNLDLNELLTADPFSDGVLKSYIKNKVLNEDDRKVLVKTIVQWLLSNTEFPTRDHYETLAEKICALFPSENVKMYYVAPFTEGENQKCAKGKLPSKVKNAKTWLRRKGSISKKSRKRKHSESTEVQEHDDEMDAEVVGARAWLERNKEPFEDVRENWKICRAHRLRSHIQNNNAKPHEYVKEWFNILKLSQSHQLIQDDYADLPNLIPMYNVLQGSAKNLTIKWPNVSKRLYNLCKAEYSRKNGIKQLITIYEDETSSQDVKDRTVLEMLCELCKPQGIVKVGSKSFKPSACESKRAFLLSVSVAANFENDIKAREEYYKKLGASIQPYFIIVGTDSVEACYTRVDDGVKWRLGSVLQALDVCFKSFFALNAEYPPESRHLWLFIQHALYGFELPRERSINCVTALIGKLASLQNQ